MLTVERIGFYAQLVDGGRKQSMHTGYTESGALDWQSFELANALVGNALDSDAVSAIEITLGGISILFEQDATVALSGAHCTCLVDEKAQPMHTPIFVKAGSTLSIAGIGSDYGMRTYLAIRGDIQSKRLFESIANVKREGCGGNHDDGRPLQVGDKLAYGENKLLSQALYSRLAQSQNHNELMAQHPFINEYLQSLNPDDATKTLLHFIPGYQWDEFSALERAKFSTSEFALRAEGDRMGIKLQGQAIKGPQRQLYSQGLCNGAIQCSGGGQLMIMLNDRQTIGGYPILGALDAFSRARLAQCHVGSEVSFIMSDALNSAAQLALWMQNIKNLSQWVDRFLN
jgi:allophanate hydrolase